MCEIGSGYARIRKSDCRKEESLSRLHVRVGVEMILGVKSHALHQE